MRLIDADALLELWDSMTPRARTEFDQDIMLFPQVDAEPVRHGQWIDTGSGQECSVCGEIQYGYDNYRYYCSYCGAKMDGADE